MYRYVITQIVGCALLLAAFETGWLQRVVDADTTNVSLFIAGCTLIALLLQAFSIWDLAGFIAEKMPLLGLCGTVIGFMIAFSDVDPNAVSDIENIAPLVAQMLEGMGVALTTTLVGILSFLWLELTRRLCNGS